MKKILALVLTLALSLSVMTFSASAESEKTVNYLLLGDSITEGFGVANPDEASYGRIIADTNGWSYANESRMARDTERLLSLLDSSYSMRQNVINADIISLSIGANDYLANDEVVSLVAGALFGLNNKKLDQIAAELYENLCAIMQTIRELNPDAVIFMQKYYNSWSGFAYIAYNAGLSRVNAAIDRYNEEHPGEVTLCDFSSVMNGHKEYLADDCVHPNSKGNVAIARYVLKQFHDMGLCEATEPVINVPGEDYNYFEVYINKTFGSLITVIVKIMTGNAVNLFRK